VDSPNDFARTFILHENNHATRVVTLSAEELGTMLQASHVFYFRRDLRWVAKRIGSRHQQNATFSQTMNGLAVYVELEHEIVN